MVLSLHYLYPVLTSLIFAAIAELLDNAIDEVFSVFDDAQLTPS